MDSEMIANCGIKCNTLKHLHEKKKQSLIPTQPLLSTKKEHELKNISQNFRSKNPLEIWIQFSLAARNSFKECLGIVFLLLRGCNTLTFSNL